MHRIAWFFDSHSHKNIRINHDPDVKGMARAFRSCDIAEVTIHAKAHDGFAYYPTTVGTPHPRMVGDPFGDAVKACKEKGIRILAYLSFGIDGEGGRKHPEWAQVFENGPQISEDWFISVCPFTPYLNDLMLPQIAEILERYPVDGFFFDTMGAMGVCYCDWCQKEFREQHGRNIPREASDPGWGVYGRYRHQRSMRMIETVGRFITDRKPDAKVGFNQIGTVRHPEPIPAGVNCITLDFTTSQPQSLQASMCSAYGSMADKPADIMNTIFNQGWGDWTPRTFPSLEQEAAAVWARKCQPYIGDRLHPANRLDPISIRAMRFLAGVRKRMSKEYPAEDSRLVPDILVLHGPQTMYGEDFRLFATDRNGLKPVQGAHHLLLDAGANFAVAAECYLPARIAGCGTIILPEMPAIEASTELLLRKHVEDGGTLLVVGRLPNVDGRPLSWTGVTRSEKPWQDHIYLPHWSPSTEQSPVLVRGDFHPLTLKGAEMILPAIRPYDCDHGVRFGWGIGPASTTPSELPALTRFQLGKGAVWHLEAPIFNDYHETANWTQIEWFRSLLNRLAAAPVAQVVSEAGSVEVVAHVNNQCSWAFLVNHGGEQLNGPRQWARTFSPLPPFPVTLRIRDAVGRQPRSVTMAGRPVKWSTEDGAFAIRLKMDRIWRIIRVDWA